MKEAHSEEMREEEEEEQTEEISRPETPPKKSKNKQKRKQVQKQEFDKVVAEMEAASSSSMRMQEQLSAGTFWQDNEAARSFAMTQAETAKTVWLESDAKQGKHGLYKVLKVENIEITRRMHDGKKKAFNHVTFTELNLENRIVDSVVVLGEKPGPVDVDTSLVCAPIMVKMSRMAKPENKPDPLIYIFPFMAPLIATKPKNDKEEALLNWIFEDTHGHQQLFVVKSGSWTYKTR